MRKTKAIFVVCIWRLACIKAVTLIAVRGERIQEDRRGEEVHWTLRKSVQSPAVQERKELSLKCQREKGEEARARHLLQKSPTVTIWSTAGVNNTTVTVKVLDINHFPLYQQQMEPKTISPLGLLEGNLRQQPFWGSIEPVPGFKVFLSLADWHTVGCPIYQNLLKGRRSASLCHCKYTFCTQCWGCKPCSSHHK